MEVEGKPPAPCSETDSQLASIRVVDLTRILSGPFCTMLLADLGADVIKIETPDGGDSVRRQGAVRDGLSWYFAAFNRNKRSVVLDLRAPEGKALLERLIAGADVVVENYRAGVLEEMGFHFDRLRQIKPDIVVCSISGFGQTGPYRDRPAFDFIAQAMSGLMSVNGDEDGPPLRSGLPLTDLVAGLYAALGVVGALVRRQRTGAPERVDTAMLDGLVSFAAYIGAETLATGRPPRRSGNDHPIVAPYGLFAAEDGDIAIAPANDQVYHRLLDALDLGELKAHPDFATNELRVRHRARINALVGARIALGTQAAWIERLNRAGVPCGRVMDFAEVFADPQIAAREMVLSVPHPAHGTVRMPGFPIKFGEAPCRIRRPAPELGADTDEVLRALGVDDAELDRLRARGVVGARAAAAAS
jgi:crotonobetainyl-CoA:carnitine CoA-transferase CaiB-like acyl-CoA transferase